jgi:hypothetical protein
VVAAQPRLMKSSDGDQAVPELIKLERYERRTSALRDRAIRALFRGM